MNIQPLTLPLLLILSVLSLTACSGSSGGGAPPPVTAPTVTAVFPPGAGAGVPLTLEGAGFGARGPGSAVQVSGVAAAILSWTDTEIVFAMPAGFNGTGITIDVVLGTTTITAASMWSWEPGVTQLTAEGTVGAAEGTWHPNGTHVYYASHRGGASDLFRVPSTGGVPERLTQTPYNENWVDVDPASGLLAYGSDSTDFGNVDGDYEIWVDGVGLGPLEPAPTIILEDHLDRTPAWSPSPVGGVYLAFSSEDDQGNFIIKGATPTGISTLTYGFNPRFDPRDPRWIVHGHYEHRLGAYSVRKSDILGQLPTVELVSGPNVGGADWSVTGKIVFAENTDLWVMDEDGSNREPLLQSPHHEYNPRWSPDGRRIVFDSFRASEFNVYVYEVPPTLQ